MALGRPFAMIRATMTAARTIRVFLVEDHRLVRHGVRGILETDPAVIVVGEAADGRAAVPACRRTVSDVIVMDITLPGLNGIDTARNVVDTLPGARVLMLSM